VNDPESPKTDSADKWEVQLRKGSLEVAILAALWRSRLYGLEILRHFESNSDLVVVEGTSPANLTAGPGHLRDTPLPGQAGVSEILGRRATFGAPFGRLAQLRPGDEIQAITGQGYATYRVAAVSDVHQAIDDQDPDRLVLVTASSATVPAYDVTVDARLTSPAQAWLPPARTISTTELPLAGDGDALGLVVLWGLALAAVSAAGTFAAIRWARWPAYLVTLPIVLAVLWNLYQGLAELLPNVY